MSRLQYRHLVVAVLSHNTENQISCCCVQYVTWNHLVMCVCLYVCTMCMSVPCACLYHLYVMQRLEKAAKELSEEATSGIFLDPDNNPMKILRVMKGVRFIGCTGISLRFNNKSTFKATLNNALLIISRKV